MINYKFFKSLKTLTLIIIFFLFYTHIYALPNCSARETIRDLLYEKRILITSDFNNLEQHVADYVGKLHEIFILHPDCIKSYDFGIQYFNKLFDELTIADCYKMPGEVDQDLYLSLISNAKINVKKLKYLGAGLTFSKKTANARLDFLLHYLLEQNIKKLEIMEHLIAIPEKVHPLWSGLAISKSTSIHRQTLEANSPKIWKSLLEAQLYQVANQFFKKITQQNISIFLTTNDADFLSYEGLEAPLWKILKKQVQKLENNFNYTNGWGRLYPIEVRLQKFISIYLRNKTVTKLYKKYPEILSPDQWRFLGQYLKLNKIKLTFLNQVRKIINNSNTERIRAILAYFNTETTALDKNEWAWLLNCHQENDLLNQALAQKNLKRSWLYLYHMPKQAIKAVRVSRWLKSADGQELLEILLRSRSIPFEVLDHALEIINDPRLTEKAKQLLGQ